MAQHIHSNIQMRGDDVRSASEYWIKTCTGGTCDFIAQQKKTKNVQNTFKFSCVSSCARTYTALSKLRNHFLLHSFKRMDKNICGDDYVWGECGALLKRTIRFAGTWRNRDVSWKFDQTVFHWPSSTIMMTDLICSWKLTRKKKVLVLFKKKKFYF